MPENDIREMKELLRQILERVLKLEKEVEEINNTFFKPPKGRKDEYSLINRIMVQLTMAEVVGTTGRWLIRGIGTTLLVVGLYKAYIELFATTTVGG